MKKIVKAILCCVIAGLFLFTQGESVWAKPLYVDKAAAPGGDGSKLAPFRRITDAVNYVRGFPLGERLEIKVKPGTYIGRYSNTDPNLEDLPIIIDIPNLKLTGSISMLTDESGLPTGEIKPETNTMLIASPALLANQSLLIITPSVDPSFRRLGVEVSRFSFNGGYSTRPTPVLFGTGISVERVQDFTIRNNYVTGWAEVGIRTRASSGKIQGNYISKVGSGTVILAGSASSPANVKFSGNRSVNNFFGGLLLNGGGINDASFDRLTAVVDGNDLSDNNINPVAGQGFGIRVAVVRHDPPNPGTFGNVTATVSNNRISNNNLGFSIEAGFPYRTFGGFPDPRLHNGTLYLFLEGNVVSGNLLTPALISFTRNTATFAPSQLTTQWKYLEHSTYYITDSDGDLNGYWFDHPASDPVDGRTLQNTLIINGVVIPNGRYVPSF